MKKLINLLPILFLINCANDGLQLGSSTEPLNYNNGSLITGTISSAGLVSTNGTYFSELENGYLNLGFYCFTHSTIQDRKNYIGDDFVVPTNESWKIDDITFYFYKGVESDEFPVNSVMLEIYDGDPSLNTSHKIYGDFTTNLFSKSEKTNIYRIAYNTTALSDAHQIFSVQAKTPSLNLQSGHYYFKMTTKYKATNFFYFMPQLPQKMIKNTNGFYNAQNNGHSTYYTTDPDYKFDFPFLISGTKTIN